ncbi:MAG TPA: hypothetical protein VLV87_00045 [Gammaproteobacteria bacterium]|nr:hypothetical protein [Gammaproteobacteria bacterium]
MKKFLAMYTGTTGAYDKWLQKFADPEARKAQEKAGMEAWTKWAEKHGKAIVEGGGPLGKTKQVSAAGIQDIRNNLAAYVVVQAESQEAAAKMFLDHPHFSLFPGDAVEIMEILPVPNR